MTFSSTLEDQTQLPFHSASSAFLEIPVGYVRGNLPHCPWTRDIAIRVEEIGMIENVRYVPAELKGEPFCQLGVLIQANVVGAVAWSFQYIHAAVTEPTIRWNGKGGNIKPMIEFALACR